MKGWYIYMGLDMYMLKIEKPTQEEINEACGKKITECKNMKCLTQKEFDYRADRMKEVLPYIAKTTMIATVFNYKMFKEDYGIDEDDEIIGQCTTEHESTISFLSGKHVMITPKETNVYLEEVECPTYLWHECKVDQFRNEYDFDSAIRRFRAEERLRDAIQLDEEITLAMLDDVALDNCDYGFLTMEERMNILGYAKDENIELHGDYILDKSINLFYVAWW